MTELQLIALKEDTDPAPSLIGNKAASLIKAWSILPIPTGVVVPTTTVRPAIQKAIQGLNHEEDADILSRSILANLANPLPAGVVDAIENAVCLRAGVAVRSSSPLEDLCGASGAGIYESYLQVLTPQSLREALESCVRATFSPRAITYRRFARLPTLDCDMAMIVQPILDAVTAGVAFTKNPVSDDANEMILESSPGLGTGVVNGALRPTRHRVRVARSLGSAVEVLGIDVEPGTASDKGDISVSDVEKLVLSAAQLEYRFGTFLDLEWAKDRAGDLWLLQVRPVTS